MTTYIGGKGGSGVYQKIINQIPPHTTYVEPFLGMGAVMRAKRPADINIGVDADVTVLDEWDRQICDRQINIPHLHLVLGCGISYIETYLFDKPNVFVYCDPPYPLSTRGGRAYYNCEMSDQDHMRLLAVIKECRCMVAISSYPNEMYEQALADWRSITFTARTRGGRSVTEKLWMNYPEPNQLHDYRYLGENYRERERIKKKKLRWRARLERMSALERYALLSTIADLYEDERC